MSDKEKKTESEVKVKVVPDPALEVTEDKPKQKYKVYVEAGMTELKTKDGKKVGERPTAKVVVVEAYSEQEALKTKGAKRVYKL